VPVHVPPQYAQRAWTREEALIELVRGRLEGLGPTTAAAIAVSLGMAQSEIDIALLALEAEGFAMRGSFTPHASDMEWCERRLLARINRYTVKRLRQEIEPIGSADFLRFLFDWQHVTPDERMEGPDAVAAVICSWRVRAAAAAWKRRSRRRGSRCRAARWMTCAWPVASCGRGRGTQADPDRERPSPVRATPSRC
jgi:ATP-dependent Lhr-like helicase